MPSFGAASRADGDTRLGVSLRCIQDRERRGRGRVRGDIVHQRPTALLSARSIIAAARETSQTTDFCDLSRKPAVTPRQLCQNDSCCCASKRYGIGVETREPPLVRFAALHYKPQEPRSTMGLIQNNQRAIKSWENCMNRAQLF